MESAATPHAAAASTGPAAGPLPPETPQGAGEPGSVTSLLGTVGMLIEEAQGALRGRMELFSLELRRTNSALAQMVGLALLAGLLASVAWLTLMVGLYMVLVSLGLHWSLAVLAVLLVNAGGAVAALMRARSLTSELGFPATRRRLRFGPHRSEPEPIVPPTDRQEPADGHP